MRDILIGGLMIAVVIILIRVIFGTPLVKRVRESFADAPKMINSQTECPPGATMYMFNGSSYCCSGAINGDAVSVKDSCRPYSSRDGNTTFCTLGPSTSTAKNCLELRSGLMQAEGEAVCPSTMPTFVKESGDSAGRCCADPGNPALTACVGTKFCDVGTDPNMFKDSTSCQFLKAQGDTACPKGFGTFTAPGQGAMSDITLFGCTDNGTNCYADSTLKRLKELGYDTTGLVSCSNKSTK